MEHIMLDIETLDTANSAVVLSIGAVKFSFEKGADTSLAPFFRSLKYDDQMEYGRTVSESTLQFWMAQSEEARGAAFNGVRTGTTEALTELTEFITAGVTDPMVWAKPACFDLSIMEDLFKDYRMDAPWGHRNRRCLRTLYDVAGSPDYKHEGHIIPHHPVSDCQVQITEAMVSYKKISSSSVISY